MIHYSFIPLLTVTGQRVVLNLRRLAPRPQTEQVVSRFVPVGRQISARPRSSVWDSVEYWMTSQSQTAQRDRECGEGSDAASALELLSME